MSNEIDEYRQPLRKFVELLLVDAPIVAAATLSQFCPTAAAIWALTTVVLQRMSPNDLETFHAEFESYKDEIAEEVLHSEDFARASLVTFEAASRTKSEEKIRLLARLLHSGVEREAINGFDDFKEYVEIADSLSPKELVVLSVLDRFLHVKQDRTPDTTPPFMRGHNSFIGFPEPRPDDPEIYLRFRDQMFHEERASINGQEVTKEEFPWLVAKADIKKKLNVTDEVLAGFLYRLSRTGLIILSEPPSWGRTGKQPEPELTPIWMQFRQFIAKEDGKIISARLCTKSTWMS